MRWITACLVLIVISLVVPHASAQGPPLLVESDSYVLVSENSAREKIILRYVFSQNTENGFQDNFQIFGALSDVNVHDRVGKLQFSVGETENGWSLITYSLREALRTGDRTDITVEFIKAVEEVGGNSVYAIRYKWSRLPTSYQVIVKLPTGYSLISTSENTSEVYVENGNMYMRYSGVLRNSFQTYIVFKSPPPELQLPAEEQPTGGEMLVYAFLILVAAAIPLAVFIFYRARLSRTPKWMPRKAPKAAWQLDVEKILRMLHGKEKDVVELLIQRDSLTQAELCGLTGIPRATMSRLLRGLENKGVVRRIEHGMSKKVILSGWLKEQRKEGRSVDKI